MTVTDKMHLDTCFGLINVADRKIKDAFAQGHIAGLEEATLAVDEKATAFEEMETYAHILAAHALRKGAAAIRNLKTKT